MAIRQIIGLNHLGTNLLLNSYGFVGTLTNVSGGNGANTVSQTLSGGVLTAVARMFAISNNSGRAGSQVTMTLTAKHTDGISRKSIFGMQVVVGAASTITPALPFITLCGVAFNYNEIGIEYSQTNYFEFVINRETNTVSVYNTAGTKVTEKPATTSLYTVGGTVVFGTLLVGNAAGGQGYTFSLSKMVMLDDTQDDTPCDRMGPIDVVPFTIDAVEGSDSTPSDGTTLLQVINTPIVDVASQTAPYIQTPKSQQPLLFSINAAGDQYASIKGLAVMICAKKDAGTDAQFKLGLQLGEFETQGDSIGFTNSNMAFFANFGVQNKAADGMPFTWDKINNTKVVLTPVSANP